MILTCVCLIFKTILLCFKSFYIFKRILFWYFKDFQNDLTYFLKYFLDYFASSQYVFKYLHFINVFKTLVVLKMLSLKELIKVFHFGMTLYLIFINLFMPLSFSKQISLRKFTFQRTLFLENLLRFVLKNIIFKLIQK